MTVKPSDVTYYDKTDPNWFNKWQIAQAEEKFKEKSTQMKIKSDGGSTRYYDIPEGAKDLQDLIEHKKMEFGLANIFKACYRFGEKEGNELEYEIRKMEFFVNRLKKRYNVV